LPLDATLIARVLADAGIDHEIEHVAVLGPVVRLGAGDAPAALRALKECTHAYSFLVDLFGIDTGEEVDVAYHVRSFVYDEEVHLRVRQPYGSTLASVWEVYPAALTAERECAEMFGLLLSGHPNPKRLLTTEGSPPWLLKQTAIRSAEEVRNR
jgi:NADH:ubiquinone oxidoreductase subunit C